MINVFKTFDRVEAVSTWHTLTASAFSTSDVVVLTVSQVVSSCTRDVLTLNNAELFKQVQGSIYRD